MTKDEILAFWKTLPRLTPAQLRDEAEKRAAHLAAQWKEDCHAYLTRETGWVLCQGRDESKPRTEPAFISAYHAPGGGRKK